MAASAETLSTEVKKLKSGLQALRKGGAAAIAKKRKKKPIRDIDVIRAARKRLRRASKRLHAEKAKLARAVKPAKEETPAAG